MVRWGYFTLLLGVVSLQFSTGWSPPCRVLDSTRQKNVFSIEKPGGQSAIATRDGVLSAQDPYDCCKWSRYNPYTWPYNWVSGVISPCIKALLLSI